VIEAAGQQGRRHDVRVTSGGWCARGRLVGAVRRDAVLPVVSFEELGVAWIAVLDDALFDGSMPAEAAAQVSVGSAAHVAAAVQAVGEFDAERAFARLVAGGWIDGVS